MNLGLTDKPVLVCASSAGLGRATAMEFAREGARVMLTARREDELKRAVAEITDATGNTPKYLVADLTKAADVTRLVQSTTEAFGGLYTVVNNSGGPPAGTFERFDDAAWQSAFELNLLSYIRVIRAAVPAMRAGGGGRIVNFTSSSVKSPIENLVLSNTFRTGVLGLSKTLAGELGPDGILVNVLGPGRVQTERITQLDTGRAAKAGISIDQVRVNTSKTIPLGRYGVPDEYARVAVFLGSPANTYVTGQTLLVDGGMVKAY
ncbi:MAG TPA: SDR family oxidoreductase [Gemmatimonadaceae bacterium]|nr:SDR family oxidoreductase [Gemmatimonadaceae bacterium]